MRTALATLGVLATAGIGWFGYVFAGWSGTAWALTGVLAAGTALARSTLAAPARRTRQRAVRPPDLGSARRFARYHELSGQLRTALRDGRYHSRVLDPYLHRLGREIAEHRNTTRAPTTVPGASTDHAERDRDDPPNVAELNALLSDIEAR